MRHTESRQKSERQTNPQVFERAFSSNRQLYSPNSMYSVFTAVRYTTNFLVQSSCFFIFTSGILCIYTAGSQYQCESNLLSIRDSDAVTPGLNPTMYHYSFSDYQRHNPIRLAVIFRAWNTAELCTALIHFTQQ